MAIKIINETPVTMAELKEDLKKIKERDSELNYRAQKTEDYLNIFVHLNPEQAKEIYSKIEVLGIPRFKPEHIAKVIDILPTSVEEAKSVLSAYPITVTNDNLKKIVDAVKPFAKSAKELKAEAAAAAAEAQKAMQEQKAAEDAERAEAAKEAAEEKLAEEAAKAEPAAEKPEGKDVGESDDSDDSDDGEKAE